MTSKDTALVVLSGGQDSTTCLFWAIQRYKTVHAITVNYGQRHARELEAAQKVWELAKPEMSNTGVVEGHHLIVEVPQILKSSSPLTSSNELETYKSAEEMAGIIGDRVELTFVPMRNAFFLTLAANYACHLGAGVLVTGVCEEDNANYPDCRQVFIDAQQKTINEALGGDYITIDTPLMKLDKAASVKLATEISGAYNALAYSHTAYSGEFPPVTQDHATVLRADGFARAGIPDPLILRAWTLGLMSLPLTENYSEAAVEQYLAKVVVA
jgi:7-cyano-7-deazaguanine synthase